MENLLVRQENKINQNESELKRMFNDLVEHDTEEERVMSELFYSSVKMIFDMGFELAHELNEELLAETMKDHE